MPFKDFLEEYPLYKKYYRELPVYVTQFDKPAINMECKKCDSIQTFNQLYNYNDIIRSSLLRNYRNLQIIYRCASCKGFHRYFDVYISPNHDYCYKFGQYPAWDISIDKQLEDILKDQARIYKNGLICESQGYGIGAYAYFRRIVEVIIDDLLESISNLIEDEKQEKYKEALEESKRSPETQKKIENVKDLLPSILRPDGINPLQTLYSELSEGLHGKSDEECLNKADYIKKALEFLVRQVKITEEASKKFKNSMHSLHKDKSDKNNSSNK